MDQRENYLNFINSSQQSLHNFIDLINRQDHNYYNITRHSYNNYAYRLGPNRHFSSVYDRNTRNSNYNNIFNQHRSSNLSYPSQYQYTSSIPSASNLSYYFQNITNSQENRPPNAIEILRAVESKIFSSIENPVNSICPISQEDFTNNQKILQIKFCQHNFKEDSLLQWLSRTFTLSLIHI